MIEGAREELDDVNEFFHDAAAGVLYFIPNASDASPVDGSPPSELVVPHLAVLFSLLGAQEFPVLNVSFEGVAFADGRPTFMDPHAVPGPGDWALERSAAVFVEGAEGVLVADAHFSRIDGNALMLSGYTRDVLVRDSEFVLLGGSAIALWGRAADNGYDITGGQQPRGTVIERCFMNNIGIIQKQSSGAPCRATGTQLCRTKRLVCSPPYFPSSSSPLLPIPFQGSSRASRRAMFTATCSSLMFRGQR